MIRTGLAAGVVLLAAAALASAQPTSGPLRWQTGQTLTYRVEQIMLASDTGAEGKVESRSKLNLLKRWQVLSVDAAGIASLQLTLASLRLESTTPSGDKLLFDSIEPDKSTPELRQQLSAFVGKPLALLRVDGRGRVVEVKESKFGPASRYENELPFVGVLPADGPKPDQTWQREYKITLEQGAGEKYDAIQNYICKGVTDGVAVTALTTALKTPPPADEQEALLQLEPEGEILFDLKAGRLKSASLKIDREVKGRRGEGSSYRVQSTYSEEYVGDR